MASPGTGTAIGGRAARVPTHLRGWLQRAFRTAWLTGLLLLDLPTHLFIATEFRVAGGPGGGQAPVGIRSVRSRWTASGALSRAFNSPPITIGRWSTTGPHRAQEPRAGVAICTGTQLKWSRRPGLATILGRTALYRPGDFLMSASDDANTPMPPESDSSLESDAAMGEPKAKKSKRGLFIGIGAVVVVLVVGVVVWIVSVPSTDDNYWESLQEQGLTDEYLNREIAVAQGRGFCDQVRGGQTSEAVWYQKTAVDFYCPEFSEAIQLVPTEEEKEENYLGDLRAAELGGEFASDAAAISSGRAVCARLDEGGENQGPPAELIAVNNFCPDYAGGFRELTTFEVTGTFVLYDDDYLCVGGGIALSRGYDDISASTDVKWENQDGERLATTTLGEGNSAGRGNCEWTFTADLPEGEERYLLTIGRRGTQEYTEAELKVPETVAVSLGSIF